ncbi:Cohesin subunit SCC3 [Monocercomonoides exilis]|uniref:Cohesin subunit SCC3 n=1 Tax=Monocercomonoides exilis TaxID=2049356 RepID=UPI00355A88A9|nr:Cohesin subunit SCC3 [Monocercomonoides exilis]|eukprot:MONOS_9843.1-p1 / transcript=MONOS_9843.1 / gene=MONOS_9843 / organism=Monocercomonoides_exilis_PA203 / gene_product=Cohesin subunit SCC3 / transcript_product=Cohesin subunit SCC3 / location=Mono_scaffold00422:10748-18503(+) / protein_length=2081 / sequence_SO=supercontig / SO=protein_coding / is_pseudo=false
MQQKSEGSTAKISKRKEDFLKKLPDGFFAEFVKKPSSLRALCTKWRTLYTENHDEAILLLLNFLLHSSGCNASLEEVLPECTNEIATELLEHFPKNGIYPLAMKQIWTSYFDQHFRMIPSLLMREFISTGALYEDDFEPFFTWLVTLSGSNIRPFRHTNTLLALEFISALIVHLNELNEENNTNNALLEAEQKPKKKGKINAHHQHLIDQSNQLKEKIRFIEETIQKQFFTSVFVHRYRDSIPAIRVLCITKLGEWIILNRKMFLSNLHTKYLGWMLNDRVPAVREASVWTLHTLFSTPSLFEGLLPFAEFFLARLVEMTNDVSEGAAVGAILVCCDVLLREYEQEKKIEKGRKKKETAEVVVDDEDDDEEEEKEEVDDESESEENDVVEVEDDVDAKAEGKKKGKGKGNKQQKAKKAGKKEKGKEKEKEKEKEKVQLLQMSGVQKNAVMQQLIHPTSFAARCAAVKFLYISLATMPSMDVSPDSRSAQADPVLSRESIMFIVKFVMEEAKQPEERKRLLHLIVQAAVGSMLEPHLMNWIVYLEMLLSAEPGELSPADNKEEPKQKKARGRGKKGSQSKKDEEESEEDDEDNKATQKSKRGRSQMTQSSSASSSSSESFISSNAALSTEEAEYVSCMLMEAVQTLVLAFTSPSQEKEKPKKRGRDKAKKQGGKKTKGGEEEKDDGENEEENEEENESGEKEDEDGSDSNEDDSDEDRKERKKNKMGLKEILSHLKIKKLTRESKALIPKLNLIEQPFSFRVSSMSNLSLVLFRQLPSLFVRFATNNNIILCFILLLPSLDWNIASDAALAKALPSLLQHIPSLILKHQTSTVLSALCSTFSLLLTSSPSTHTPAEISLSHLYMLLFQRIERLIEQLKLETQQDGEMGEGNEGSERAIGEEMVEVTEEQDDSDSVDRIPLQSTLGQSGRLKEIGAVGKAALTLSTLHLQLKRLFYLLQYVSPLSLLSPFLSLLLSFAVNVADGSLPSHNEVMKYLLLCLRAGVSWLKKMVEDMKKGEEEREEGEKMIESREKEVEDEEDKKRKGKKSGNEEKEKGKGKKKADEKNKEKDAKESKTAKKGKKKNGAENDGPIEIEEDLDADGEGEQEAELLQTIERRQKRKSQASSSSSSSSAASVSLGTAELDEELADSMSSSASITSAPTLTFSSSLTLVNAIFDVGLRLLNNHNEMVRERSFQFCLELLILLSPSASRSSSGSSSASASASSSSSAATPRVSSSVFSEESAAGSEATEDGLVIRCTLTQFKMLRGFLLNTIPLLLTRLHFVKKETADLMERIVREKTRESGEKEDKEEEEDDDEEDEEEKKEEEENEEEEEEGNKKNPSATQKSQKNRRNTRSEEIEGDEIEEVKDSDDEDEEEKEAAELDEEGSEHVKANEKGGKEKKDEVKMPVFKRKKITQTQNEKEESKKRKEKSAKPKSGTKKRRKTDEEEGEGEGDEAANGGKAGQKSKNLPSQQEIRNRQLLFLSSPDLISEVLPLSLSSPLASTSSSYSAASAPSASVFSPKTPSLISSLADSSSTASSESAILSLLESYLYIINNVADDPLTPAALAETSSSSSSSSSAFSSTAILSLPLKHRTLLLPYLIQLASSPAYQALSQIRSAILTRLESLVEYAKWMMILWQDGRAVLYLVCVLLVGCGNRVSDRALEVVDLVRAKVDEEKGWEEMVEERKRLSGEEKGKKKGKSIDSEKKGEDIEEKEELIKPSWRVDAQVVKYITALLVVPPDELGDEERRGLSASDNENGILSPSSSSSFSSTSSSNSSSSTSSSADSTPRTLLSLTYATSIISKLCRSRSLASSSSAASSASLSISSALTSLDLHFLSPRHAELTECSKYLIEWGVRDMADRGCVFAFLISIAKHLSITEKWSLMRYLVKKSGSLTKEMEEAHPYRFYFITSYFDTLRGKKEVEVRDKPKEAGGSVASKGEVKAEKEKNEERRRKNAEGEEEEVEEESKDVQRKEKAKQTAGKTKKESEKGKTGKKADIEEIEEASEDESEEVTVKEPRKSLRSKKVTQATPNKKKGTQNSKNGKGKKSKVEMDENESSDDEDEEVEAINDDSLFTDNVL